MYDKDEYVIHERIVKQALSQGLVLQKVHRVIKFNQKDRLKPRRFYLARDMTNLYLFKVRWNDHLVNQFCLMYCYGINRNILHLIFSRAEF